MIVRTLLLLLILSASPAKAEPTLRFSTADASPGVRLHTSYILRSLLPHSEEHFQLTGDELTIDCQRLAEELCTALAGIGGAQGELDFPTLRTVWLDWFLDTRESRGNHEILVDALEDFATITGYREWDSVTVDSRVKGEPRRIYRGSIHGRRISVAETLTETGEIRETEVAIERIDEAWNFEFYTYNVSGEMVLESEFPSGTRPSPVVCAACHMHRDGQAKRFIGSAD